MTTEDLPDSLLLAYLDGEVDAATAKSIESNAQAQTRLQELTRLRKRISERLPYRPTSLEIGEYELGLLPKEKAQQVEAYLKQHPHARGEQQLLHDFLAELDAQPESEEADVFERVRLLIAEIVQADDTALQPAAGMRGIVEGVYRAGDAQIVIELDVDTNNPAQKSLTGLLLGIESSNLRAELWQEEQMGQTAVLDEFGNFIISGIIPGIYQLIIRGDNPPLEIHIQALQV